MSTEESRREIGKRLEAVRSSIRRAQWTRGGLVIATVMLGGLLLMMALDHFLAPLPQAVRWAMFGVWVLGTLVAAAIGLRPLLRKIGLIQVARWIEGRHPEIEERMSTVLELSGGHGGVSESLLEELAKAAGDDVGKVDARAELKAVGAAKKWARPALLLSAAFLLLLAAWPKEVARLAARAVAPFSTLGNAAAVKFSVKPGDVELLEGDALDIAVSYDGPADQLALVMTTPGGSEIIQPMLPAGEGWSYRLDPVREGFRYKARAGRGESDGHEVTMWPLPSIPEPRVRLAFPEYTGLPVKDEALGRGIEAVLGTKVELTGVLNTAVEAAWLMMDGKRVADGTVEKSASGGRVEVAWDLNKGASGEAVLVLKHRLGREVEALRFPVRVLEDLSPVVRWVSPIATELKVRPDEVLGLRYEVTEDFGVEALQLEVKTSGKEQRRLERSLPEKLGGAAKPARYRGESEMAVGELLEMWPGASEFRLRVRAEDGRTKDLDGPGVGHSEWLLIKIDQHAESLARQELRAEHDGARETIEAAMRQAREARERMDWHRGEMKNEELSKDAVKHFEEARERLAEAQEDLEKLAERMQESVHATKADEVREASEQLAQARQELETAPLQDGQQQREEKLDHAREQADAAVKNLEKAREAMERDRQKVEELARFQELAQQQRELARQAEKQAAEEQTAMNQEWQDRQRGVEEQLRQQLREQPQARAEVLEAQAEEARKLADEAKALSESQKGLEEQSKQELVNSENSPEGLREALEKEQSKIAEEAAQQLAEARQQRSEVADQLPEAVAATEQVKEALSKGDDKAAAQAAKEAAEAMKNAVGEPEQGQSEQGQSEQGQSEQGQSEQGQSEQGQSEQGQSEQGQSEQGQSEQGQSEQDSSGQGEMKAEIEALAERQGKVAEALDALAEGKAAEALQGLQQLQADEAKKLSDDISQMPQVEGSGPMNEARDTSRQGSEQALSAAEKGGEGKAQEAAGQHEQSAANLQRSADALGRAAEEFDRAAQQARGQQAEQHRAPLSPEDLAEAFQSASRASEQSQASQSANQAAQVAEAMAKAAQAARQQMQGQGKPGQPGQPKLGLPGDEPGDEPDEDIRMPQADPGVPPELAKLGISASDWEKIQATLKSDVGGSGAAGVPEEYRGLVRKYFEAMTDE